jgi:hypothetical protein
MKPNINSLKKLRDKSFVEIKNPLRESRNAPEKGCLKKLFFRIHLQFRHLQL